MSEEVDMDSVAVDIGPAVGPGIDVDRADLQRIHLSPPEGNITYANLDYIEADLDFYEKISLVFLLYESVDLALQHLKKESYTTQGNASEYMLQGGLFSGWARSERSLDWEERFLEALCIVQNFYVVEKLGYDKEDMLHRFLPENPHRAVKVDLTRKVLYIFCEKLTADKEKCLIRRIEEEIGQDKTPSFIRRELKCMETFLLYLMSHKHILCHNGIKIITRHLKAMDEMELSDFLEPLSSRCQLLTNHLLDEDDVVSMVGNNSAPSIVSSTDAPELPTTKSDNECYRIHDPKTIGLCVIINQKKFYADYTLKIKMPDIPLEHRIGTDEDRDLLQEAFGNFGFTVQIWEDLKHNELIEAIEFATRKLVKEYHSYFVLCILSHGARGSVYGVNSVPVSIDEIHMKIQGIACPQLLNKPKILIIQACQGDDQQAALSPPPPPDEDIVSDGPTAKVPAISDSLIITSTIPGYVSYRNKITGSWFIQSLCKHLLNATEGVDLDRVFLKVSNEVQGLQTDHGKSMQPVCTSTLKSIPYLPCRPAARKQVALLMMKRVVFLGLLKEYLKNEYIRNACLRT